MFKFLFDFAGLSTDLRLPVDSPAIQRVLEVMVMVILEALE